MVSALRRALFLLAVLLSLCSCDIANTWRIANRPTAGGGVEVSSLASSSTGTTYSIYVSLPDSYETGSGAYPLLFLLDGDAYFSETRSRARALHSEGLAQEVVIVGIGYGAGEDMRNRDYTPTRLASVTTASGVASGGAGAFLAFITDELLPWTEAHYRISSERGRRGIMGHSYGGLFAFYTLFHSSDHFGLFVASSPSIGWDKMTSFSYEAEWAASGRPKGISLFTSSCAGDGFPLDALLGVMGQRVATASGAAPVIRYYENTVHADAWQQAFADGMAALLPSGAP
jgi:Predicted hydrolase of the alpha/beta superfamily